MNQNEPEKIVRKCVSLQVEKEKTTKTIRAEVRFFAGGKGKNN